MADTFSERLILEKTENIDETPTRLMDVLWRDTQETTMGRLSRVAAAQGVSIKVVPIKTKSYRLIKISLWGVARRRVPRWEVGGAAQWRVPVRKMGNSRRKRQTRDPLHENGRIGQGGRDIGRAPSTLLSVYYIPSRFMTVSDLTDHLVQKSLPSGGKLFVVDQQRS